MIRFLNLKDQITEGESDFAFYDTVSNRILTFDDEQVFSSIDEFEEAYINNYDRIKPSITLPLERFTTLIPKDYFNKKG